MKPYKLHEGGTAVLDAKGNLVASCGFLPGRELVEWKRMAAEIVKACNAHDDLLAACKLAIDFADQAIRGGGPVQDNGEVMRGIRAAVAAAEGSEG